MKEKNQKETILSYLEDASNLQGGSAQRVMLPETVEEVSDILKEANASKTPVTISGGGTGTTGGRIPFGGIVISTELLKGIEIFNRDNEARVKVAAGVLIQDLKHEAEKRGLFYPYDPTEQTAFVGGTIATNASGARSLKYGSTRNFVRSLEVVLADGNIIDIKRGEYKADGLTFDVTLNDKRYIIPVPGYRMPDVKKHSAGYFARKDMDLVDLFIGQEGTLGLVVSAEMVLLKKPFDILSCFAFFNDEVASWSFAQDASKVNTLSVEYLDFNALNLLRDIYSNIPYGVKACVFFEQEMEEGKEEEALGLWEKLLALHGASIDNTWVAMTESERKEFQEKRHKVPEKINDLVRENNMPKVSTDLAVPAKRLIDMMKYYKEILQETGLEYFIFGHIGDAHLHTNIIPENDSALLKAKQAAVDLVKKAISLGGTPSAEHGIGKLRREYLKMLYGEDGIKQMLDVKQSLDTNLILNRGNIIAEEYLKRK